MTSDLKNNIVWHKKAQTGLAAGTAVLCALLYFTVIMPASNRLTELRKQVSAAHTELQGNRARAGNLPVAERETQQLRSRVERFDKKLPKNADLAAFINDVTQMSQSAALRKLTWRPDSVAKKTDQFARLPIQFSFEGDFSGVFDFLREIEDMPRLTRVRKLDMQSHDAKGTQMQVQLSLDIYYTEE